MGMITEEVKYQRRLIDNQLIDGINGFGEVYKCLSDDFGKVCMSFDDQTGIDGFDMNLMDESVWDEVIEFEIQKRIIKCVDLVMMKLCVDWNKNDNLFVIELKVLLAE